MLQHQVLEIAKNDWENEGGALSEGAPSRAPRFLTELYVVDGHAYTRLSDASAGLRALRPEAEKL